MSIIIRLELSQPGSQILSGNNQLYNGAGLGEMKAVFLLPSGQSKVRICSRIESFLREVRGSNLIEELVLQPPKRISEVVNTFKRKGSDIFLKQMTALLKGLIDTKICAKLFGRYSLKHRYTSKHVSFRTITSKATFFCRGGSKFFFNLYVKKLPNNETSRLEKSILQLNKFFDQAISAENLNSARIRLGYKTGNTSKEANLEMFGDAT
jgi:hypothetical protein